MSHHDWALNKTKLQIAIDWAKKQKELDPKFEVSEATIKARYIELKGMVATPKNKPLAPVVSANPKRGVVRKGAAKKEDAVDSEDEGDSDEKLPKTE